MSLPSPIVPLEPESDAERERQEVLRFIAESVISGEYQSIAISMIKPDGERFSFYDGSAVASIGLAEMLRRDIIRMMESPE